MDKKNRTGWTLKIKNISKKFFNNLVLDSINLDINEGEFHALIGENGAGKSTLINLITGVYQHDSGAMEINGRVYENISPYLSQSLGIQVVHQELSLNGNLTVAENIFLGKEIKSHGIIRNQKKMNEEAKKLLKLVELEYIDPRTDIKKLSLAQQQLIEFAKTIYKKPRLLILDEATSALNNNQVELMFSHLKKMKEDGLSIIFISHRLHELGELCDIMTVLKDGKQVVTEPIDEFDEDRLVTLMTGRTITDLFPQKHTNELKGKPDYLVLNNVSSRNCKNLNIKVKKGEILGLGGLAGQGQESVMEILFGIKPVQKGSLCIEGKEVRLKSPKQAMANGIAYLPAERKTQSLFVSHSINNNMSYARLREISNAIGTIDRKTEKADNIQSGKDLEIKYQSLSQPTWQLSGGNQQKVVLAKWLKRNPQLILLNEPTRGIDVGTKKQVYELLRSLADNGRTVILLSSDTMELIGMCDRVVVMYENQVNAEILSEDLTEETLVHASVFKKGEF